MTKTQNNKPPLQLIALKKVRGWRALFCKRHLFEAVPKIDFDSNDELERWLAWQASNLKDDEPSAYYLVLVAEKERVTACFVFKTLSGGVQC
jgi:hypothetical protein